MVLKFEQQTTELGSTLLCPSCGGNYLHHDKIEVFEREPDAETGLHVTVENGKVSIDRDLNGNPSSRRHGENIHFRCENCEAKPVLSITQHKGNTCVGFKAKKIESLASGKINRRIAELKKPTDK